LSIGEVEIIAQEGPGDFTDAKDKLVKEFEEEIDGGQVSGKRRADEVLP
jgi:hypothetical protein